MPQQNTNAQQPTHVIASPNPTIDDSKTPATETPKTVGGTPVKAVTGTTSAPMKAKRKSKSRHRRTTPGSD
jgi:hypothetical protein